MVNRQYIFLCNTYKQNSLSFLDMPMLLKMQRRFLSASAGNSKTLNNRRWSVKQVTKSNFKSSLDEFRSSIDSSDFVALSLQNTGSYAAAWHRVSAIDTPQTSYLKAKYAAERYQIFQFALCPFSLRGSKLTVHPYDSQVSLFAPLLYCILIDQGFGFMQI